MNLLNWKVEIDSQKIAWATFDKVNSSMNTLNHETLTELNTIIETTEASEDTIGLVIRSH